MSFLDFQIANHKKSELRGCGSFNELIKKVKIIKKAFKIPLNIKSFKITKTDCNSDIYFFNSALLLPIPVHNE